MTNFTLYLLRHGESVANVERVFAARKIDPPLSDRGIQQITMQAKSLRDLSLNSPFEFSALYASPLLRAKHTAEIVSQWCGLEPIFSEDLMEVDVGILDGENQEDAVKWAMYENVMKKWEQGLNDVGFQGGESLNDIECRFRRFLEELENKRPEWEREAPAEPEDETQNRIKQSKDILVVGHCLLFMAVIWLFCENHGPTLEDGHMGRGHLSVISRNNDRFRLLKFNIPPGTSRRDIFST
ncbi:histidine phosphatase family protein [Candidatus Poribacteria bacterium]|nr:histidine phosphatase family protein [Candidatus Poribacteria bacterium]